jgi:CRISPR-associated protein Cmr6
LTLHLARASALENAGICLHPLYGFTYFPGSGLKGMARAFAETVWFPAQFAAGSDGQPVGAAEEQKARDAWAKIEQVFGWAPFSDNLEKGAPKPWKPRCVPKHSEKDKAHSGRIVFHDAWPEQWPRLYRDILNNHHSGYYQGEQAPGDWENPIPVYFLAVVPDQVFSFAVYKRTSQIDGSLLALAKEWLLGGLCHLGAGAKTAAGYGNFVPVEGAAPPLKSPALSTFQTTLELVTPAFLAGAKQQKEDCDLRGATLRGMLRWWWRTMHAGFVDVQTLRDLEARVWGETTSGSAVRLTVERNGNWEPELYEKRSKANMTPQEKRSAYGILGCDPAKTTQGLWYLSFGMDDKGRDERRQRYYIPPGAKWTVRLTARASSYPTDEKKSKAKNLDAEMVLEQAKAALWLLCHFGALGSKGRKGFGSFAELGGMTMEDCLRSAAKFRRACGVPEQAERDAESPVLGTMLLPLEVSTPWKNAWFVLDQLGFSAQGYAKEYKYQAEKKALGLPRRVGAPVQGRFKAEKGDRHASPVHYHLVKKPDGTFTIRVALFPAMYPPDIKTSREFLGKLLEYLKADLEKRAKELTEKQPQPSPRPFAPPSSRPTPHEAESKLPRTGQLVDAVLVEDPKASKGKNRRFAKDLASGLAGKIQNAEEIPAGTKIGDKVQLIVVYCTPPGQIQFKWPKPGGVKDRDKPTPHSKTSDDRSRR